MDDIKASVCMVTYNHERYIAQAVQSVLEQETKFPFEVVIGEDCSTDNTRSILVDLARQNPDTIRLRLAESNQGAKANFLDVVTACRGKYVAMLEGDDYWICPNKLQLQVDALDAHPDWAICFHPTKCVYEEGMQGQSVYPLGWNQAEATLEDLLAANFIPTSSTVFRNGLFGEFPPWFRELLLGDWPLHILNAAHGNIGCLPEVMSAYRIHRNGIWSGRTPVTRMTAIFQMFTAVDHHFAGRYAEAIDRYRLNAVREVMVELDAAKDSAAGFEKQLQQTRIEESIRMSSLEERFLKLQSYCDQLAGEIVKTEESIRASFVEENFLKLQNRCDQLSGELISVKGRFRELADDHRKLQEFYDSWRRSVLYRVFRETRRPFTKLLRYWQNRRASENVFPPIPESDPASKAA
jgi:glycosyltransferase involved in cell wall biosynthesis